MRRRTLKYRPASDYTREELRSMAKSIGVYKAKYSKDELMEAYRNKLREVVQEVKKRRK